MKMQFTKTAEPDHGYQEAAEFPALPAMKTLGHLAVSRPVVIRDTREQTPLVFSTAGLRIGHPDDGGLFVCRRRERVCRGTEVDC